MPWLKLAGLILTMVQVFPLLDKAGEGGKPHP